MTAAGSAFALPRFIVSAQPRSQAERPPAAFSVGPAPVTVVKVSPSLITPRLSPSILSPVKHARLTPVLTTPRIPERAAVAVVAHVSHRAPRGTAVRPTTRPSPSLPAAQVPVQAGAVLAAGPVTQRVVPTQRNEPTQSSSSSTKQQAVHQEKQQHAHSEETPAAPTQQAPVQSAPTGTVIVTSGGSSRSGDDSEHESHDGGSGDSHGKSKDHGNKHRGR
jgi:hypothetical protein